jgi:hypothetical protein
MESLGTANFDLRNPKPAGPRDHDSSRGNRRPGVWRCDLRGLW